MTKTAKTIELSELLVFEIKITAPNDDVIRIKCKCNAFAFNILPFLLFSKCFNYILLLLPLVISLCPLKRMFFPLIHTQPKAMQQMHTFSQFSIHFI